VPSAFAHAAAGLAIGAALRPIRVSPIGVGRFFTAEGLAVIRSELTWVFLPSLVLASLAELVRRTRGTGSVVRTGGA
jgi:inner membrane protein